MKILFEILVEELPTSEMLDIEDRIKDTICNIMDAKNIEYTNLSIFTTPRRMAGKIECLDETKTVYKKIVGPPEAIAYEKSNPTKALLGFLRKNNASLEDAIIEETNKGKYVVILSASKKTKVSYIFCEVVNSFLHNIYFAKKMRWANEDFSFVRPIHNILVTADDNPLLCDFGFLKSTDFTYTHRFMGTKKIKPTYDTYAEELEENFVIADRAKRKEMILSQLSNFKKEGFEPIYDDKLLNENVDLCEYPTVVLGKFDTEFLNLPAEVLITSMRNHQKYFAFKKDNNLSNYFAAVSNTKTPHMDVIISGYERVLRARFSDAKFFYEADKKHKLESYVKSLKNMVFLEKLGNQFERTERLIQLSNFLANVFNYDVDKSKRAAYLSKADLLTQMVYEFPELEGIMGREYAKISGEDSEVANAIYEQYLPKDDEKIETKTGVVLSLANKIDLITGCFIANLKPTGNKDPYGLRRAALGIVKVAIEKELMFSLQNVLLYAAELYKKDMDVNEIIDFIKMRFFSYFFDYPHDVIVAVVSSHFDNLYDASLRLAALLDFIKRDFKRKKQFSIKRIFNIVPDDFDGSSVNDNLFVYKEEHSLYNRVLHLEHEGSKMLEFLDYGKFFLLLSDMEEDINEFFDNVLVMDKNSSIKINRLSILNRIKRLVFKIANFKALEI